MLISMERHGSSLARTARQTIAAQGKHFKGSFWDEFTLGPLKLSLFCSTVHRISGPYLHLPPPTIHCSFPLWSIFLVHLSTLFSSLSPRNQRKIKNSYSKSTESPNEEEWQTSTTGYDRRGKHSLNGKLEIYKARNEFF